MPNELKEALESTKAVEETTGQPAPTEESTEEVSELETKDESKKEEAPVIDYKALLEAEQAKTKRAEEKIVKMKKAKSPEVHHNEAEPEEEVDEDRVAALVQKQMAQMQDKMRGEIVASEVDDLLTEISSNLDERELIRHIYENRLARSGFTRAAIRSDLEDAKILANKDALVKSNKELSEALKSKSTLSSAPNFGSGTRKTEEPASEFNATEKAFLAKYGVKKP